MSLTRCITLARFFAVASASIVLIAPLASTPLAGPTAALACTHATIGGVGKCLQRGEF